MVHFPVKFELVLHIRGEVLKNRRKKKKERKLPKNKPY